MNRSNVRLFVAPLLGLVFVAALVTWQVQSLSEPATIGYEPNGTSAVDPSDDGADAPVGGDDGPTAADGSAADGSAAGASDGGMRHVASVAGTAADAGRAITGSAVSGGGGDLLLTAVATKPARPVGRVEGLGLEWQEVHTQCSGRGTTEISLWAAVATEPVTGDVVAELASGAADIAMLTARYTGVDAETPIGATVGANVNGDPDHCEDGADDPTFEVALTPTATGSRTVVFAASRQFEATMAPPLVDRAAVRSGTDGSAAGLAVGDDLSGPTESAGDRSLAPRVVGGTTSRETDWAVVAVELLGEGQRPQDPTLLLSTDAIDFGPIPLDVGAPAARTIVEVGNDGVDDLVVESVAVEGPDAEQFLVAETGPFVLASGATRDLAIEFHPDRAENASATVHLTTNDPVATDEVRLTGRGGPPPTGMWISAAELADLPMQGPAWERLVAAADGELGEPGLADFVSRRDVRTLAVALVYARTGDDAYRAKARDAIVSAIGSEAGTTTAVQPCRNLAAYVIAADLIDLSAFDPESDRVFRDWIDRIRYVEWSDGSFIQEDEQRANNHGRMCGMSRAAIAVYLDDRAELAATASAFARFLGDTTTGGESVWRHDLSWQADPNVPVGVNPAGAQKDGVSIDGALPEEMRRGGPFQMPPVPTEYPWEALQAVIVEAVVLDRAGYDVFDWSDQAILRSVEFLAQLHASYPDAGWWATGDDTWVPWVVNDVYGTDFATERANLGKSMGWTDWTHAPG